LSKHGVYIILKRNAENQHSIRYAEYSELNEKVKWKEMKESRLLYALIRNKQASLMVKEFIAFNICTDIIKVKVMIQMILQKANDQLRIDLT
jgi:hypothetical protein